MTQNFEFKYNKESNLNSARASSLAKNKEEPLGRTYVLPPLMSHRKGGDQDNELV